MGCNGTMTETEAERGSRRTTTASRAATTEASTRTTTENVVITYLKASNTAAGANFGISVGVEAYLKTPVTPANNDAFGSSVDVDGNVAVVAAYGESSCATGVNGNQFNTGCYPTGAVY